MSRPRGYQSLFNYLLKKSSPKKARKPYHISNYIKTPKAYAYLYDLEDNRNIYGAEDQLRGSLQPLAEMGKDTRDTFKRYKSSYYVARDFLQPLRGLINIVKGLFSFIVIPFLFCINTFRYLNLGLNRFSFHMKLNLVRTASWLIEGVANIIRGATQLITFPLAWLRTIVRGLVTAAQGKPKIEDNVMIQHFTMKGKELLKTRDMQESHASSMNLIMLALRIKYEKGIARGISTSITAEMMQEKFPKQGFALEKNLAESKKVAREYLNLFIPKAKVRFNPTEENILRMSKSA